MTIAIAFLCVDGVVIATDSMLTPSYGENATGHHPCRKLHVLHNKQLFAFAGDLGQAERFRAIAERTKIRDTEASYPLEHCLCLTQRVLQQFNATGIKKQLMCLRCLHLRLKNLCIVVHFRIRFSLLCLA